MRSLKDWSAVSHPLYSSLSDTLQYATVVFVREQIQHKLYDPLRGSLSGSLHEALRTRR